MTPKGQGSVHENSSFIYFCNMHFCYLNSKAEDCMVCISAFIICEQVTCKAWFSKLNCRPRLAKDSAGYSMHKELDICTTLAISEDDAEKQAGVDGGNSYILHDCRMIRNKVFKN